MHDADLSNYSCETHDPCSASKTDVFSDRSDFYFKQSIRKQAGFAPLALSYAFDLFSISRPAVALPSDRRRDSSAGSSGTYVDPL